MASLTEHLRRPDDHGRLAFHPDCPLCREERLAGPLPPEAVVGRRTQAVLAAGVLALSSATPTAAVATEPDEEHEGATAPEQVVPDETLSDPGFDPGGETELQFDVASGPAQAPPGDPAADTGGGQDGPPADPADDTGPVEQEPTMDAEVPVADPGDGTDKERAAGQPTSPSSDPLPAPSATKQPPVPASEQPPVPASGQPPVPAPAAAAPPSDAPIAEAKPTTPTPTDTDKAPAAREKKHEAAHHKQRPARAIAPSYASAPAPAPQPEPVYVSSDTPTQATPEAAPAVVINHDRAIHGGDRFHVVQQGESLWSIASDLLGQDASTARIARQVNRLWELNSARIATGDRNLIMTGTRIALR
jgi:hypothetical protein